MATNLPIGGTQIDSLPSKTAVQDSDKLPISRDGSAASVTVADFNDKTNGIVGDAFDTAKSYSAGDYCIYNDTLYKFTADKSSGAWSNSVVEATDVGTELNELNTNTHMIQCGNITFDANGNSITDQDISFGTPFPSTPRIFLSIYSGTNNPGYGGILPMSSNVSTTGFTLRIANNTSTGVTPRVNWMAII